jgi:hypothetical protein
MTFDEADKLETDRQLEQQAEEQKQKADAEKAAVLSEFEILDRLKRNPDFHFFVERYLMPQLSEEHDMALDINAKPETRNNHAQQHHRANRMLLTLQEEHERLRLLLAS